MLLLTASLSARTWTDRKGRSIEADPVRMSGDSVIVSRGGKEMPIKRDSLSDEDIAYLKKWEMEQGAGGAVKPTTAGGGTVMLDGKPIETSGKANLIEKAYSAEALKEIGKQHGKKGGTGDLSPDSKKEVDGSEKGFKISVSLPKDFNPTKAMNVFLVITAVNSEAERKGGNIPKARIYEKSCVENGWVCLAIDSDNGVPISFVTYDEAFALLTREWPGFANSRFSAGGFSGGSKGCWSPVAWLLKSKRSAVGVYMGGCNEDYSERCRKEVGAPSSGYRKLRAFMSTGKTDAIAPPASSEGVMKSLKSNGVRDVKYELFDGGHAFYSPHFVDALKWFAEP